MEKIDLNALLREHTEGLLLVGATLNELVRKQVELVNWINEHEKEHRMWHAITPIYIEPKKMEEHEKGETRPQSES